MAREKTFPQTRLFPEKLAFIYSGMVMPTFLRSFYSSVLAIALLGGVLVATPSHAQVASFLAPSGTLRASINLGNPILAKKDAAGRPVGVSVDMATELAKRLGLPLELVVFDAAGKSVDALSQDQADIGFFAVDPVRGKDIAFTAPYVLIEGSYLVRHDSALTKNEEVDRAGTRIAVGKGSAYDLFLAREIKTAQIMRAPTSPTTVDFFLDQNLDVAAGVKQQLEMDAKRLPNLRLLPGRFMVIEQAMGLPKKRNNEARVYLQQFVEDMKSSGFVANALNKHNIEGAVLAPLVSVKP
jgi:polar amino acid transport system substrate-binding protein